jgi:hypothetical protein
MFNAPYRLSTSGVRHTVPRVVSRPELRALYRRATTLCLLRRYARNFPIAVRQVFAAEWMDYEMQVLILIITSAATWPRQLQETEGTDVYNIRCYIQLQETEGTDVFAHFKIYPTACYADRTCNTRGVCGAS